MSEAFGIVDPAQLPVRRLDIIKPRPSGLLKFSTQIEGAVEEVGDWTDVGGDLVGTVDGKLLSMSGAAKRHIMTIVPADSAAGDELAETIFGVIPGNAATVTAVRIVPTAAVVGHKDNYAEVAVYTRDSAGGNKTKLAVVTTEETTWTTPFALVAGAFEGGSAPTEMAVAADTILTYETDKYGAGVKLPDLVLVVEYVTA